jgi:hypothetical protein
VPPPKKGLSTGAKVGIGIAVVVVLGLIAGGLTVLLAGDDAEAGEVFLEAAGSPGADPFTDSVSVGDESGLPNQSPSAGSSDDEIQVTSVNGDEVGLYGGTQGQGNCDPDQLVEFLEANPDKAQAWADAQGIVVDDIAEFVDDLTPVRLVRDTRVTNHGYRDGRANPIQSVLQAGTAVLVDDTGLPRVKCSCGNPLLAPTAVSGTVTYQGSRWSGFSPTSLTVINVQQVTNVFVIQDVDDSDVLFERPVGTTGDEDRPYGEEPPEATTTTAPPETTTTTSPPVTEPPDLGGGDVQVTLAWDTEDDLDLYVTDPQGSQISYSARTSPSGGELDVDDTAGCGSGGEHVENVFWPTGGAPIGDYTVYVDHFGGCNGGGNAPYTVEIRVGGELVDTFTDTLAPGAQSSITTFSVG